jgi:hypothetical protein
MANTIETYQDEQSKWHVRGYANSFDTEQEAINYHLRGSYNEIQSEFIPGWVAALIDEAERAGAYERGIESDRKGRGSAINVDVYGYDEEQRLAVIQVRQAVFRPGRFTKVHKDYYLIGYTESGNVFAHPVETPARSKRALESPEATVRFVLARIWNCAEEDLAEIVRQGDVAFIPAKLPAGADLLSEREITIRETHRISAEKIYKSGDTYFVARAAKAVHTKRQHATIRVKNGFYRVQAGIRASVWGFTRPMGD